MHLLKVTLHLANKVLYYRAFVSPHFTYCQENTLKIVFKLPALPHFKLKMFYL